MKQMKDLKKFSKEWWKNFWFYYKWHLIIGVIAIVLVVGTIIDKAKQVKPDIHILFSGDYTLTTEDEATLKERFEASITDINGDGKVFARILYIPFSMEKSKFDESTGPANQQIQAQFVTGDQHIYILDRPLFNRFNSQGLLDPNTLFETTADNPLFEGTLLAEKDLVMVTRVKRHDMESDFTTSQQVIDRYTTPNLQERYQNYVQNNQPE